jgi:hypothetical protein
LYNNAGIEYATACPRAVEVIFVKNASGKAVGRLPTVLTSLSTEEVKVRGPGSRIYPSGKERASPKKKTRLLASSPALNTRALTLVPIVDDDDDDVTTDGPPFGVPSLRERVRVSIVAYPKVNHFTFLVTSEQVLLPTLHPDTQINNRYQ